MSGTDAAEEVYARALHDAAFLARVRAAYTGRHNVLDALWWLSRPLDAGPSGAPAPQVLVRELQRRVYSADADPAVTADEGRRLREALHAVETDRRAIDAAIEAASAEVQKAALVDAHLFDDSQPARSAGDATADDIVGQAHSRNTSGVSEQADHPQPQPQPEEQPTGATRRGTMLVAIAAILAMVAGGAVGAQWLSWSQAPSAPGNEPVSVAPSVPPAAVEAHFDTIQDASIDTPQTSLPEFFDPASLRLLTTAESSRDFNASSPSVHHSQIFAARSTSGLTCLVAVPPESGYASSCVVDSEFPPTGLSVYWVVRDSSPESETRLINWSATWSVYGEITTTGHTVSGQEVDVVPAVAPDPGEDEIVRLVYDRSRDSELATAIVPDGTDGFIITGACGSGRSGIAVQYQVSTGVDTVIPVFRGTFDCNQGPATNVMVSPVYGNMVVRLALIGDLSSASSAYVVLSRYVE